MQRFILEKKVHVFTIDAFKIASEEATDPELRYRMQGTSFLGAFFRAAPLAARHGLEEEKLFEGIEAQVRKSWGHLGERVMVVFDREAENVVSAPEEFAPIACESDQSLPCS